MANFKVKRESGMFIGDADIAPASGKISITQNGENIDVAAYALADVNVDTHEETFFKMIDGTLTEFDIPEGVTKIKEYLFEKDTLLERVSIPSTLVEIGQYTFSECESLHTISLDNNLRKIGAYAFYKTGLTSLVLPDMDYEHNIFAVSNRSFASSVSLISAIINCNLSNCDYCFSGCSNLTDVVINNSRTIAQYCFASCTNLKNVTINSQRMDSIQASSFMNCTSLETFTIPASVTIVGNAPFFGCTDLTSVYILNSNISNYDTNLFYSCTSLTDVYFVGTQAQWEARNISIPAGCTVHYEYTPT